MSDTTLALALAVGLTGAAYPTTSPKFRLAEVSGEVKVEAPRSTRKAALPELPSGSKVTMVSGYGRIESDLPGTIWLEKGDQVTITELGMPGRGALIEATGSRAIGVEAAESRMILEPGQALIVRRLAADRVVLEAAAGPVHGEAPGWSDWLAQGETSSLRAGPAGWRD
ncbi:MAG: hypothetical protein HY925_06600, partial [Elusimicrobia bacterium]|nr:hypothetical protein [Elusimicrobiota bacterium]